MGFLHQPQRHHCKLPSGPPRDYEFGTIWQCDDCETYWEVRLPFGTISATEGYREWCVMRPRRAGRALRRLAAAREVRG